MNLCECGCGLEVSKEGNRFLSGHNQRGTKTKGMTGKHHTEDSILKLKATWEKKRLSGYTSPLKGKPKTEDHKRNISLASSGHLVTEESRQKCKATWERKVEDGFSRSDEFRKKVGNSTRGEKNGFFGKKHSEETKAKLRTAWKVSPEYKSSGKILGYFFSTKLNDNIPYRSSYELAYLKQLESDPLVVSYEYEGLRIGYSRSDGKHTTIPDFLVHYIDGHTELVEVKSDWCIDREDVQAKIEAMKRYASEHEWTFKLVTEKELFEEGVEHALAS